MLPGTGVGKDFPIRNVIVQEIKPTIDRWDYIKLKSFCAQGRSSQQGRRECLVAIHLTED